MGSRDETFSGFSSTHFIFSLRNSGGLSTYINILFTDKTASKWSHPWSNSLQNYSSSLLHLGGLDAQLDQFAHPYCPQSPHLWLWTLQRWILSPISRRDQPLPG